MTPSPPAPASTACRPLINRSSSFTPSSSSPLMKLWRAPRTPTNSSCDLRAFVPLPTPPARKWSARWPTSSASPANRRSGLHSTDFNLIFGRGTCHALPPGASRLASREPRKNFSLHFHSPPPRCSNLPELCLQHRQSARAPAVPQRSNARDHRRFQVRSHFSSFELRQFLLLDHLRTPRRIRRE